MKAKEARKFIGKFVEWDEPNRVSILMRRGWVKSVQGRNVEIDGDWKWLPDIEEFRIIEVKEKQNEKNI